MKRLRVGILDLITNKTDDAWLERRVMLPNFATIMPQAVAVWAEELGCEVFYETYTGREDLSRTVPSDIDVLFVSCFSRASYLGYAIARQYRAGGTVTVLGGPHARSFAAHASPYFDYICKLTDKETIRTILASPERHPRAVVLDAPAQPTELPTVKQRVRFIDHNLGKNVARRFVRTVPMIGSVGCPYACHFCVDAVVPYKTLPYAQIVEDLRFIASRYGSDTLVFWHDPNFGVRFDEYMAVIAESGAGLMHGGETSLSLLGDEHLKEMKKNRWVVQVPGIESWNGFSDKGGSGRTTGLEKVRRVADHVNRVLSYVPYVQTNFVLGLDDDAGDEPFELTKAFVDLAPGAFPGYSILTDFRNAPLSDQLGAEGRTISVPHPFLDNTSAFNVRLRNYSLADFYERLIDLQRHTWNARAIYRRLRANSHRYVKVTNFGRAITEGGWRWSYFERMKQLVARDPSFLRHYEGQQAEPSQYFFDQTKRNLGRMADWLPPELTTPAGFVESERRATAAEASLPVVATGVASANQESLSRRARP